MSLTMEWENRLKTWINAMERLVFTKLGQSSLEGFVTSGKLIYEDAVDHSFVPMPDGTNWGGAFEYGWFKTSVTVPKESAGSMFVLLPEPGSEAAVYVNGISIGAKDMFHNYIILSECAFPGEVYDIVMESYAGHGTRECHSGVAEPGRIVVPAPPKTQAVVGKTCYGIWNEEIYQLLMDVNTLYKLRNSIDHESLRCAKIDEALREFTLTADFELPREQMLDTVTKSREILRPLLLCKNGSTAPMLYVFGHSHIDVAWLWTLDETQRKCLRTFSTQLGLMDMYPGYKYLQSQPYLYSVVKDKYPDLYVRIREKVKTGQFIPEGGMWVEPDVNISGGESLIRQLMHGRQFFSDEFGIENKLCWLPDVFGYTASLPQILKGCGVDYFATHKLFWTQNEKSLFPYNSFMWEGIDNTRILSHIFFDYNSYTDPQTLMLRWKERVQKDGIESKLVPFGHGDGGGGPLRDHLEYLLREEDLEGLPRTKMTSPVEFFKDLEKTKDKLPVYFGELYYQAHRGTYTSQAKSKMYNRKCEFALRQAEILGTAACLFKGFEFDSNTLDAQWKTLLLNQFHDILPGTSINKVYEESHRSYAEILSSINNRISMAASSLTDEDTGLTVFNTLSWESKKTVQVTGDSPCVIDPDGNIYPVQRYKETALARIKVPSSGWISIYPSNDKAEIDFPVKASERSLENKFLKIILNDDGEIISLYDKEHGREYANKPLNSLRMYKDVPTYYDAWEIESMYKQTPFIPDNISTVITAGMSGPLFASIIIEKKLNDSYLSQEIVLCYDDRRLDFKTRIDWRESHKLLKVSFPVNTASHSASSEIQFGYLDRPNHHSTEADRTRFETANQKWTAMYEESHGFAVLNDCKYGVDVFEDTISLTLLKSPLAPDMSADKGIHEFTYSAYPFEGPFSTSDVTRQGYELNTPVTTAAGSSKKTSMFDLDHTSIIIDTIKPAQDNSGDIIIRMYESLRMSVKCSLSVLFDFTGAYISTMIEDDIMKLLVTDNMIPLEFKPFEIKTVRIKR